jgi:hypothetical protein
MRSKKRCPAKEFDAARGVARRADAVCATFVVVAACSLHATPAVAASFSHV